MLPQPRGAAHEEGFMFKRPGSSRRLNLRKTLFILPNLVTLSSVFCGFDAIRLAAEANGPKGQGDDDFLRAAVLICFSMVFDMLDGRVARMTKTQSAFGLQIDSLADVIAFGVAPATLVYEWTLKRFETVGLIASFLYVACAAVRLARFNVLSAGEDGKPQKPSKYFLGLPTPPSAGILVSLVIADNALSGVLGRAEYARVIFAIVVGVSFLMVSNVQFRTFKDVRPNVPGALFIAFAIASSAVVVTQLKPAFVLVWLLGLYVLLGIFETLYRLPGKIRERRSIAATVPASGPPPAAREGGATPPSE
jgi:CDP-diacylglycerol--serine O-phosphatidyltransferase